MLVTWATTKPLFILANDLQKMSRLDLEVSEMETPRVLPPPDFYLFSILLLFMFYLFYTSVV